MFLSSFIQGPLKFSASRALPCSSARQEARWVGLAWHHSPVTSPVRLSGTSIHLDPGRQQGSLFLSGVTFRGMDDVGCPRGTVLGSLLRNKARKDL